MTAGASLACLWKWALVLGLGLVVFVGFGPLSHAQWGLGVAFPLEVFGAWRPMEALRVEVGLPLGGFGFSAWALFGGLKLLFGPVELAGVPLTPSIGAGAAAQIGGAGAGGGALFVTPYGLVGMEYPVPDTAFSVFGELGLLAGPGVPSFLFLRLGARWDF